MKFVMTDPAHTDQHIEIDGPLRIEIDNDDTDDVLVERMAKAMTEHLNDPAFIQRLKQLDDERVFELNKEQDSP